MAATSSPEASAASARLNHSLARARFSLRPSGAASGHSAARATRGASAIASATTAPESSASRGVSTTPFSLRSPLSGKALRALIADGGPDAGQGARAATAADLARPDAGGAHGDVELAEAVGAAVAVRVEGGNGAAE